MTQAEALNILKTGANVFLTGEPGSGKTHTVNEFVRYLKSQGVEPAITASTGIAATHIGGMTIHSWAGIGIKRYLSKYELDKIATNERVHKRVSRARVLIIDEISMLGPDTLDMIDAVCRTVRRSHEPFGGLTVLLVGDFFQLPPVVKREELNEDADLEESRLFTQERARFAYQSSVWARANLLTCYLHEQYRQDDQVFLNLLGAIRRNEFDFDGEHLEHVEKRKVSNSENLEHIPQLYAHNIDVDRVNTGKLAQIKSDERMFEMYAEGPEHMTEALARGCLSPEKLILKVGAAVMCTKNNQKERFVNGTLGTVRAFDKTSGYPIIKTRSGRNILIEPMEWTVEENGKVKARIRQVPLRLSWAITVHKSQGMSMDAALMDLSNVFEHGQGYVALSRVRRLDGLHLLGWNERTFQVHPHVLERDVAFRANSEETQATFAKLDRSELEKMHSNFVRASGGKLSNLAVKPPSEKKSYDVASLRTKYPKAYQAWESEEDGKLIQMHNSGIKISEIAKELGRKTGSITSRLRKHGLMK
ncbi:MAG: PIF1 family DEAD/DEAH box helicase [Patescibacteria group bacterium]